MKCKGSTDIERAVSPDSRVEMKMVHVDGERERGKVPEEKETEKVPEEPCA